MIIVIFAGIFAYLLFATQMGTKDIIPTIADNYFSNNSERINSSANKYVRDIKNIATAHHLSPAILFGIVSAEQGTNNPTEWDASAYNPADPSGAYGLTQVLGSTAESFNISPSILQESASASLETTVKYIEKYSPEPNNMAITSAIYNGGPDIVQEMQNGNIVLRRRIQKYRAKASAGYKYYNAVYGGTE